MRISPRLAWFTGFSAAFAVLAGYVFWGCWSSDVTFVAPDDPVVFLASYGDVVVRWWNGFLTSGKMQPTDVLWSGLLGSPLFCRELKYVVSIYCAALGMAYFLRGRGLSCLASYGAGLLLAFCGYWFTLFSAGHGGWFIWMTYGVFAFGLIDRALAGGSVRHWLFLGLVMAWGSYHQPDLWLIFSAFTGAYFVFRAVVARLAWKSLVRGVAISAAAFFLVGAPSFHGALTGALSGRDKQIVESKGSALSGGKDVSDAEARWIFATNWSLPLGETAEFVRSRLNGDTSCPFTLSINGAKGVCPYTGAIGRPYKAKEGNYRQHSLYVGWVTCLLALVGVASLFFGVRRETMDERGAAVRFSSVVSCPETVSYRQTVVFFAVSAVVFWLFSLGRYCEPVYRLVYMLPFGDYLRAPVKWHHLTEFCVCVLAGFGIAALCGWLETLAKGNERMALAFKCAVAAVVLFGAFDLAGEAKRFCAPVDYSRAVQKRCSAQLTVLPRQQFHNPQVAEMVRQGYIVSVANWLGNPNAYLVQVLEPLKAPKPDAPKPMSIALGILSVLAALVIVVYVCFPRMKFSCGK
ncbi:MAG: hypothetical protein IJG84_14440 [Kiritimatiellae bacterium]|nr:hypothetical protein [Kiritimatiellia bacterium]